jgi:hypothetical protein
MAWSGPGDGTSEPNRPDESPGAQGEPGGGSDQVGGAPPPDQPGGTAAGSTPGEGTTAATAAGYPPAHPGDYQGPYQGAYQGGYQAQPVATRGTNSLAIVALICALGGFVTIISAPIGAVLGHVARRQIRQTGEEGDGMALVSIIIGWSLTGLLVLGCCVAAVVAIVATSVTTVN